MRFCITILAMFLFLSGRSESSLDSLLAQWDRASDGNARLAISIARAYIQKDIKKSKAFALKAIDATDESDSLRVEAIDILAKTYLYTSQLDSALYHFEQARSVAIQQDRHQSHAVLGIGLGAVLLRQGKLERAIDVFIKSADYFEKNNMPFDMAKVNVNVASAYAQLEQHKKAIEYGGRAVKELRRLDEKSILLIALPNLATHYYKNGDLNESQQYFEEAEELAMKMENKRSLSLIYHNLGDLHLSMKNYDEAQRYSEKSLALKRELNQLKGVQETYHNLGYIHAAKNEHLKAIEYYKRAFPISPNQKTVMLYDKMKESYKLLGNNAKALRYAEKATVLRDSLQLATDTRNFAEISEKYEAAKKQNEILALESQNQQLEILKNRNRSWLITSLFLLFSGLLSAFFFYKNNRKKRLIETQANSLQQQKMLEQINKMELDTIDRLIEVQEAERDRIAADLHDSLGSKVATLKLYLEDEKTDSIGKAKDLVQTTYKEIKNISYNLKSGVLSEKGLIPALKKMASFVNDTDQIKVNVITIDANHRLENNVELQLFRVIQELVSNAIKHSNAKNVTIQLTGHDDSMNINVEDDGRGFDINSIKKGQGLDNIEKRLARINAVCDIDTGIGRGTSVMITIDHDH